MDSKNQAVVSLWISLIGAGLAALVPAVQHWLLQYPTVDAIVLGVWSVYAHNLPSVSAGAAVKK